MIIKTISIQRYRSIFNETLECGRLTTLIGRNGAGKSAFLQALRLFMDTAAAPSDEDYYNRQVKENIQIAVTFTDLSDEEKAEFASYLESDLSLVVQRRFPGGEYYGRTTGCEDLELIRERIRQKHKVADIAPDLKALAETGNFTGLKAVSRNIEEELSRWEGENPSRCKPYFRAGLFQGPTNIAGGKLRNRSQFVYVPPVREAESDASGVGKQSALTALVSPLIRAITDKNTTVKAAREALETDYATYRGAIESAPEKNTLESGLTALLQRYDAETSAHIQLAMDEKLPVPQAVPRIWLVEDQFRGEVARKGHGLQRLFIFSILELYEKFRAGALEDGASGNMVLAIEEPEIYQHPARARALAAILRELSTHREDRAFQFQIFLTTHSPYFVSLDDFSNIRRIEKIDCAAGPKQTSIHCTNLEAVGNDVLGALGKPTAATEASSWARLRSILGSRANEGFFSDGVILVEGDEEEAVLCAYSDHHRTSLDAAGIAIVPAAGKTNIPNLYALYTRLGIKVFTMFDADGNHNLDKDAKTDFNIAIMKLVGVPPEARPESSLSQSTAIWKTNFLESVKAGFEQPRWDEEFLKACAEYSLSADQGRKKFAVIWRATMALLSAGQSCEPAQNLWEAITAYFGISHPDDSDPEPDGIDTGH